MSSRRRAALPPDLPGFTFVELIGSGGFADVFLYEQQHPRRNVAIKVLHTDRISDSASAEFTAEGNVMALLSTHPAIVTIHGAGEAADGRPYIVMEYAPKPNLQVRYRQERFSVAEALRIGVQIAAAVETAHRAGIMHRDIKPANILVTDYNRPALTDFGIASTSIVETSAGLSIPWSAPELFAEQPYGGPEADVYALAATIYTLLSGHSPFEGRGASLSSIELIDRIERSPVPPLERTDVPEAVEAVLARAMAKRPEDRYPTALAFARALQRLQIEFALGVTPIDIIDDSPDREIEDGEDDGLTRVRGVMSIAPVEPERPVSAPTPTVAATPTTVDEPRMPVDVEPRRSRRQRTASPGKRLLQDRRTHWAIAATAAVAVVVAVASVIAALNAKPERPSVESSPQDVAFELVPHVEGLTGVVDGKVATFTWDDAELPAGASYMWTYVGVDVPGDVHQTTSTSADVPLVDQPQTCIEVVVLRADGRISSKPAQACAH